MSRRSKHLKLAKQFQPPKPTTNRFLTFQFWIVFFFHAFLLTVPLFFTWVNEELFEFNKIILLYGYTAIIGGLWLGRMILQKKFLWKRTIFDIPILLFLISQVLATIFSINIHTSLFGYYTRFNGGLLSTISYLILFYAFVNNVEKKHLPNLFFSTFLSAAAVCLVAIPEHFGHSLSCFLIDVSRNNTLSLASYNTTCWIQDVQTRVFATFGQPNWLAAYAITLIPLGSLLASGKLDNLLNFRLPTWQKVFYLIATFALFLTLIFTKSRSGVLGLAVGISFAVVFWLIHQLLVVKLAGQKPEIKVRLIGLEIKRSLVLSQLLLAILAVTVFGTPYSPSIGELITRHNTAQIAASVAPAAAPDINRLDEGGTDSGEIRKIVWSGAIKVWERYPIFGSGVETFAYSYYRDRPMSHNLVSEWDFLYNKAHNEFLNYLATTGLVGLITYLLFLSAAIFVPLLPTPALATFFTKKLSRLDSSQWSTEQRQHTLWLGFALSSGLVALSVSNFLGFSTVMVSALLFLFPAIWLVFANSEPENFNSSGDTKAFSMTQLVLFCLLAFFTIMALFQVINMWESDHVFATGKQNSEANQVAVGLPLLEQAVEMAPNEPYYYEELAVTDARIAAALTQNHQATEAATFAKNSIDISNQMLTMNPVNLNFYKSTARIYSLLAYIDPAYIESSLQALLRARDLAPTDAKVQYNIALLELNNNQVNQGLKDLLLTIQMKDNYLQARQTLATQYEKTQDWSLAKAQYEYILKNILPNDGISLEQLQFIATASAQPTTQVKEKPMIKK